MRSLVALCALLLLFSIACGGADPNAYDPSYNQPQYNNQPQYGNQPQYNNAPAYSIQGPFSGADGVVMWVDTDGRVTGVYPTDNFLMFGMGSQMLWVRDAYGGWYAVQGGQMVPLNGPPAELVSWPGVQTGLPGGYSLPAAMAPPTYSGGGGYYPSSGMPTTGMSDIYEMYNDTSLEIINNMPDGTGPPQDRWHDDGSYAGSW